MRLGCKIKIDSTSWVLHSNAFMSVKRNACSQDCGYLPLLMFETCDVKKSSCSSVSHFYCISESNCSCQIFLQCCNH